MRDAAKERFTTRLVIELNHESPDKDAASTRGDQWAEAIASLARLSEDEGETYYWHTDYADPHA